MKKQSVLIISASLFLSLSLNIFLLFKSCSNNQMATNTSMKKDSTLEEKEKPKMVTESSPSINDSPTHLSDIDTIQAPGRPLTNIDIGYNNVEIINKSIAGKWFNSKRLIEIEFIPDTTSGGRCIPLGEEKLSMRYNLKSFYVSEVSKLWRIIFRGEESETEYKAIIHTLTKNEIHLVCVDALEPIIDGTFKKIKE